MAEVGFSLCGWVSYLGSNSGVGVYCGFMGLSIWVLGGGERVRCFLSGIRVEVWSVKRLRGW